MATTKTESMEEILRAKAVKAYSEDLKKACDAFVKASGFVTYHDLGLGKMPTEGRSFKALSIHELMQAIHTEAVKIRTNEIGNKAVQDFIAKVEGLQDQIDDLESMVNN